MPTLGQVEKDCAAGMDKSVEYFKQEIKGVRTGRAHPGLIEHVKIEVASYGSTMELRELATISVPEPATLMVKPFDPGAKAEIVKAIETADLGLNPTAEGPSIRINVPSPSA